MAKKNKKIEETPNCSKPENTYQVPDWKKPENLKKERAKERRKQRRKELKNKK